MHTSTGFVLAIKMVNLAKEAGEKEKESIRKESEILRKLNDDNVVKYYGSSFPEQQLWVRTHTYTYTLPHTHTHTYTLTHSTVRTHA